MMPSLLSLAPARRRRSPPERGSLRRRLTARTGCALLQHHLHHVHTLFHLLHALGHVPAAHHHAPLHHRAAHHAALHALGETHVFLHGLLVFGDRLTALGVGLGGSDAVELGLHGLEIGLHLLHGGLDLRRRRGG